MLEIQPLFFTGSRLLAPAPNKKDPAPTHGNLERKNLKCVYLALFIITKKGSDLGSGSSTLVHIGDI